MPHPVRVKGKVRFVALAPTTLLPVCMSKAAINLTCVGSTVGRVADQCVRPGSLTRIHRLAGGLARLELNTSLRSTLAGPSQKYDRAATMRYVTPETPRYFGSLADMAIRTFARFPPGCFRVLPRKQFLFGRKWKHMTTLNPSGPSTAGLRP